MSLNVFHTFFFHTVFDCVTMAWAHVNPKFLAENGPSLRNNMRRNVTSIQFQYHLRMLFRSCYRFYILPFAIIRNACWNISNIDKKYAKPRNNMHPEFDMVRNNVDIYHQTSCTINRA